MKNVLAIFLLIFFLGNLLDLIIFLLNNDLSRDHCLQIIKEHGLDICNKMKDGDVKFSFGTDIQGRALDMINDYFDDNASQ